MSVGDSNKDGRQRAAQQQRSKNGLDKDGVLDLAQSRLLDPHLTVKDLAYNITLLVLDNPRLILVAVVGAKRVEATLAEIILGLLLSMDKQLPGTHMAVMHAVQNDTHALVCGNKCADAEHKRNSRDGTVAASNTAKNHEDAGNKADEDQADTKSAGKEDTGRVAVANRPTNKVGVSLAAKRRLDSVDEETHGSRVRSA